MNAAAVRRIQTELKELGFYKDEVDGSRGPNTHVSVAKALDARAQELPNGWEDWSDKRKSIAYLQLLCQDENIDSGKIDGWWGPQTEFAFEQLDGVSKVGNLPPPWRDIEPIDVNPNDFPNESHASLTAFYGQNGVPGGYQPPLCKIHCPWTLKIAWNQNQKRSHIWCHEKVANSLEEVLENVHKHYGEIEIKKLRLDLFGGDYNPRKKRGGTTWSTHSWGIAIDWDPVCNKLNWGRDRASLARTDYEDWWNIWEEQGWTSLGRKFNFDWMHVQAAKPVKYS